MKSKPAIQSQEKARRNVGESLTKKVEDRSITWFRNAKDSSPDHNATLEETFDRIAHKPCPIQVEVRNVHKQIDAAKANGSNGAELKALEKRKTKLKESAPGFSLSGTFRGRRSNETMVEHSGVIQADFDHVPEEEMPALIEQLKTSDHVWKIWRSISGDGLKAAVLIPRNKDLHRSSFASVQVHLKALTGRSIDEQCKDPARICFISHDPDLWTNEKAVEIEVRGVAEKPGPAATITTPITDLDPLKKVVRKAAEFIGLIDLGEWQTVGDPKQREFLYLRCPDTAREHHTETKPNTRLYLNPGSVPRIECKHGECQEVVRAKTDLLRMVLKEWHWQMPVPLPEIENADENIGENLPPEPPDIIRGLITRGGKVMLVGGSKTNKTWQLLHLGICVATGTTYLKPEFKATKGRVLYVNFELMKAHSYMRIETLCGEMDVKLEPRQLRVWNLRGFAKDIDALETRILARVIEDAQHGDEYSLIIVDPIYKLYGDRDENLTGPMAEIGNALERIAEQSQAAVTYGHHHSKGNQAGKEAIDRFSGAGAFARDADTILDFTKHEVEGAYVVTPILRSHPPVAPFCVRWEYPLMKWAKDLDPAATKQPATVGPGGRKTLHGQPFEVLQALFEHPGRPLSYTEWQTATEKKPYRVPRGSFQRNVDKLLTRPPLVFKRTDGLWDVIEAKKDHDESF